MLTSVLHPPPHFPGSTQFVYNPPQSWDAQQGGSLHPVGEASALVQPDAGSPEEGFPHSCATATSPSPPLPAAGGLHWDWTATNYVCAAAAFSPFSFSGIRVKCGTNLHPGKKSVPRSQKFAKHCKTLTWPRVSPISPQLYPLFTHFRFQINV